MLASKTLKILIVDDSDAIRISIKEILDTSSYSCKYLECDNGYDAVKLFRDESPDIVFLDIYMPKADGIQTLKAMLSLKKKSKIIMITAAANAKIVHGAIKLGARDYVLKPFDRIALNNAMTKVMNQPW